MRRAVRGVVVLAALVVVYLLADAFMPSHLPPGIVLLGLVLGALSSLVALGLVLVYRAFRIVNFSQVAMGALGASSAIVLATGFHWPYLPSVACGLAVAVAVGWVVDALFGWRFATSPRLIVTVATIGLLQLLGAAQIGLPHVVDHSLSPMASFAFPLHLNFSLDPTVFSADDLVALVVVPVVALALWWFFSRTDTGLAVRAAADSGERALLLGIPVRRLNRTVWLLAAGLSGIGAVLAVPITQSTVGVASGPEDLLAPLAAAVLARFESMPATVAWSLVIGVLQQSVYWSFHSSTYADIALFLLIVGGLAFQRRRSWRGETDPGLGDWVAVREVRRIPAALASLPEVRLARGLGLAALLSAAVLVPAIFSVAVVGPLAQATIYAVVAVSLVVLTGWAGQISLGQAAFAGVGSLVTGALLVHAGADLFVALGVSAVVGAVVACLVGLPALRLPGLQLAVVTLAFSVVVSEWLLSPQYFPLLNPDQVGRPVLFGRFDLSSHTSFYELCLAVLVVSLLLARNFRRSRIGRAVLASRDGARTASSFGISPWRAKLVAFAFAGALCGVAGGLYVVAVGGSGLTGFDADQSVLVFSMAVIGGLGSLSGGLLGAAYVWAALTWLPGGFAPLATGAGLLLVLAVFPEGLAGAVLVVRDRLLAVVARRRGHSLVEPVERRASTPSGEPSDAPSSLLVAEGLTVSIGATRVLTGVDLSVDRGTVLAVLGTNGAGKSTLLRVLAGLIRPQEGTVRFGGRDVTGLPPAFRVQAGLVTVLGGRGVFPSLSVDDNLRLAGWTLRRHHRDRAALVVAEQRVAALFPVLGRRRSVRAGDLSGGEQQMLALAQALLCRPTLLMIDELSLGLAPTVVAELLDAIRALVAEGVTVVVVEQSVNAAAAIAPSGVFLERGTVRFRGPVALLTSPLGAPLSQSSMAGSSERGDPPMSIDGTPAVLEVVGVFKQYGGVAALTDVDLSVAPSEIVGVIGANGAGKTTLLDVVSGFAAPEEGRVLLAGREITSWSADRRAAAGLGRTFQEGRLFPSLTVAEALAAAYDRHVPVRDPFLCILWTYPVARSERAVRRRVEELAEAFGLTGLLDYRISELSTGSRRIVSMACSLGVLPRVLLLDEPTAGIAQPESEALVPFLRRLRDQTEAALVIIDHDVGLLASLVDRLVCMHLGEVLVEGPPDKVLADPRVVAAYLGD